MKFVIFYTKINCKKVIRMECVCLDESRKQVCVPKTSPDEWIIPNSKLVN